MHLVVHPQLINTFMTLAARGRAVQNGTQPVSALTQPHMLGLGNTCLAMMDWPHTYPAWCVVLLMCSTKAAFVGERYSKVRDDCANICWRALLTAVRVQDTDYNEMMKFSMTAMSSEEGVSGISIRLHSVVVHSGRALKFCVSIFLSRVRKEGCVI